MPSKGNFFKDLAEIPITMLYLLFKSTLAPILWVGLIVATIIFGYIVLTG